jgi:hypothetical protein
MNSLIKWYVDKGGEDEDKLNSMLQDVISLFVYTSVKSGLLDDSTFADYTRLMRLYREMDVVLESGLITIEGIEKFEVDISEVGGRKASWKIFM